MKYLWRGCLSVLLLPDGSDNCTTGDVFGFYTTGDAAPIGRAGYYYGS